MDYFKIGERIRKFRKAKGLSQEILAEKVGISVTHMSHIETGNTKLSLPVLVELAQHLEVHTDDLLQDEPTARMRTHGELDEVLSGCSIKQLRVIVDLVKATKIALDKHM